ncbi:MAG: ATP-binding cassette domain-containing protein [Sphingobacteriales bacterium]|nr:MAG: ATP-binding cassette domain-containing protein [Sphingobacteriales bacterium]
MFENLHLVLNLGKIYGLVGKNGIGKTTLFNCMAGFEKYEGNIVISEVNKDKISFMGVDLYSYPRIRGIEFLISALEIRNISTTKNTIENIFFLPLNEYAENYSTGMKKKLYLQIILLIADQIILLDEPFEGLDADSIDILVEALKKIKENKHIIISSHRLDTLNKISDSIIKIESKNTVKIL